MRIGKYHLAFELASGGMGTVHVARQLGAGGFSRFVVVKRLHAHLARLPESRDMVRDEALLASQIHHPNVVPVVDVVAHDGELCLVFDYVPSISLAALNEAANAEGAPLDPAIASRLLLDVLAGLHAAHEVRDMSGRLLSIVHRDVSPQNVIVGEDGSAQLVDFGIAKAAVRFGRTKTGDLKGKLSYMSPEQLQRKVVDRRADVFAAGALLFEVLTGEPLFSGDDEGAIVLGILMGEPVDLVARGFSSSLDEVLRKAIATSPDERFPTARAFHDALEAALPPAARDDVAEVVERLCGASLQERRRRLQALVESAARSETDDGIEDAEEPPPTPTSRRSRTGVVIAGLVMLAAAGGLARSWLGRESVSRASPPPRSSVADAERASAPITAPAPPAASIGVAPTPSDSVAAPSARPSRRPRPPTTTSPPLRKNPYR